MSQLKKVVPVIVLAALLATALSSCQRGYGCPYKFQANTAAAQR